MSFNVIVTPTADDEAMEAVRGMRSGRRMPPSDGMTALPVPLVP
jgi:hypothetical protein